MIHLPCIQLIKGEGQWGQKKRKAKKTSCFYFWEGSIFRFVCWGGPNINTPNLIYDFVTSHALKYLDIIFSKSCWNMCNKDFKMMYYMSKHFELCENANFIFKNQ